MIHNLRIADKEIEQVKDKLLKLGYVENYNEYYKTIKPSEKEYTKKYDYSDRFNTGASIFISKNTLALSDEGSWSEGISKLLNELKNNFKIESVYSV